MVIDCVLVGIGGFFGSVLRYMISLIPIKNHTLFPVNTFIVNVIGAFLIGIVAAFLTKSSLCNEKWLLLLKVGVCGGFTTFSTFSLESLELIKAGNLGIALLYVGLSVVVCVVMTFGGQLIVK